MIIDAHTHLPNRGESEENGAGIRLAEDLIREMDRNRIDVSVVIPVQGEESNALVYNSCSRFPDRLIPIYTPDFRIPENTIVAMDRFFQEKHPRGLKIHPRKQGVTLKDTIVRETIQWAGERALPVIFDVFPFGPDFANPLRHPGAYCSLAQEFPRVSIILAHAGGYRVVEAFLAAKACSNIFLDISFTPVYFRGSSVARDLEFLCRRLPAGKLLYGSDFPEVGMRESLAVVRGMAEGLNPEQQSSLFGTAAASIYQIGRTP